MARRALVHGGHNHGHRDLANRQVEETVRILVARLPPTPPERYASVRLLWIKTIIRAAFDYALYKKHKDLKLKKHAIDAEKWLFEPSALVNGLESICQVLDISIERVRFFARKVTREQVKKLEFLERTGSREPAKILLGTLESGEDGDD